MSYAPLHRHRPSHRWTNGDLAAKVGADIGLPPDDEQRWLLDTIFAEKAVNRPASFEVVTIAPRQNIKTSTLLIAALADLFVFGVRKHLWSAHLDDTAKNTFADAKEWLGRNPEYSERVQFYEGHQDRAIVDLETGNRIDFGSRTGKTKRGLTGVERVTLDEALYLEASHMGAIYPTMLTRPGAQVRLASSAGLESSAALRGLRDRGRAGKEPRLAYVEYGAERTQCLDERCLHTPGAVQGCALDNRELWWQANCALWQGRVQEDGLADQRASLPPAEFMREFLSWWEDPISLGGAFKPGLWDELKRVDLEQPESVPAIALAGSPDGLYGAIASAVPLDDDRIAVAPVDYRRGQRWLVEEAKRIQDKHRCAVVVFGKGPLSYLIKDLQDADVDVTVTETSEWVDACEDLWRSAQDGQLVHPDDPELTKHVLRAGWKKTGDRRAFDLKAGVPLLEAVAWAARVADEQRGSAYESHGVLTI